RRRGGTGLIWKVYWFTFATRNFHNGATAVFSPLPFTTRDGLDPTIAPRSQSPKQIHVPAVAPVIKTRGHNQQINSAPFTGFTSAPRSEDNSVLRLWPDHSGRRQWEGNYDGGAAIIKVLLESFLAPEDRNFEVHFATRRTRRSTYRRSTRTITIIN